jgi:hypothetical protein
MRKPNSVSVPREKEKTRKRERATMKEKTIYKERATSGEKTSYSERAKNDEKTNKAERKKKQGESHEHKKDQTDRHHHRPGHNGSGGELVHRVRLRERDERRVRIPADCR